MRKLPPIKSLVVCGIFSLVFFSCKKNDSANHGKNLSADLSDFKFLNARLKKFAVDFAPVLSNPSARNIIRNLAKKQFDTEYEVLIKDIVSDNFVKSLFSVSKSDELHKDIYERSGEHLFPQIYIPRLQYLKDNASNKNNSSSRIEEDSSAEEPVYVFWSGDTEVDSADDEESYPAYKLVNGELEFFVMADEDYANEHEVWVLGLNETVDEDGKLPVPCDADPCGPSCPPSPDCGAGGGGGGGGGGGSNPDDDPTDAPAMRIDFPEYNHNKINFKIEYMRVRRNNESWVAGASEISIRAKLVCHNGRKEGIIGGEQMEYSSDQYSNYLGKLIKKVKRKHIKNLDLLLVNFSMQRNWQNEVPSIDPVHFMYVIFERDIWPAPLVRRVRYAPNSPISSETSPGPFNLFYRSGGGKKGFNWPYAESVFTNTLTLAAADAYAGTGLVQTPDIAFNTVLY